MKTIVIAEYDCNGISPATLSAITAATYFDPQVDVLLAGPYDEKLANELGQLDVVNAVLSVDVDEKHCLAELLVPIIIPLVEPYEVILSAATTYGKNLLPRVAAKFSVAQISDIIEVIDSSTFKRPIYAGNVLETVQSLDERKILTIRPTAFEKAEKSTDDKQANIIKKEFLLPDVKVGFIGKEGEKSDRPTLDAADVIVSGGRGLKSKENFELIEKLADCLNAAVGASRAAVDAGFIANDHQVGQTGKIVAPALYIAVGISGAIQHLAGMKDSKVVVSINKDEDAPIHQVSDYYLIGDLFEIVPQLIELLQKKPN